jgi:hypothetical protein
MAVLALLVAACREQPLDPTVHQPAFAEALGGAGEPEVFGNVYENGQRSTRTDLSMTIEPLDPETQARIRGRVAWSMWANPNSFGPNMHPKGWAYGWFDPRAGNNCGTLAQYLQGNNEGRAPEAHWTNAATSPDTSLPEGHCIRPGRYQFTLSGPGVSRTFQFEYVAARASGGDTYVTIADGETGDSLILEPQAYSEADAWTDHVLHLDLTTTTSAPTPVLRIQNSHGDPFTGNFIPETSPAANENDWLRFSSLTSTGIAWNLSNQGRALARYRYDMSGPAPPQPYFVDDRNLIPLLRVRRFDDVKESRPVVVGLQLMQPNNLPSQLPTAVQRTIQFTRLAPFACATFEGDTTWLMTDQVLDAGCSTLGANIRYRWQFDAGGPWTSYSPDPVYDYFAGHGTAGTHQVTVEALNTSTGLWTRHAYPVVVENSQVVLDGRLYVTDKARNFYTSNVALFWFERFDHDTTWWLATYEPRSWMYRIWYAGDYTVDLRQQDSSGSLLRRGRLHITRCHSDPAPCFPNLRAASLTTPASASLDAWGFFGGGPWIAWGSAAAPRVARLYDLLGMHDLPSAFGEAAWLDQAGGTEEAEALPWAVRWEPRRLSTTEVRAFTLNVSPTDGRLAYRFGFALDPDPGPDAADDATGWDGTRALAYVHDGERAVGFLLRDGAGANALVGVQQFGLARFAPRTVTEAWTAMRSASVRLLGGRSDVQLLLTTAERRESGTWTLLVLRAATVAELRARADAVLAELRGAQ